MYNVYIFVYVYICIYINIYIHRRANRIYIQKSCSIWTVCPCFFIKAIIFCIACSKSAVRGGKTRNEDQTFFSTDPGPAQLEKIPPEERIG